MSEPVATPLEDPRRARLRHALRFLWQKWERESEVKRLAGEVRAMVAAHLLPANSDVVRAVEGELAHQGLMAAGAEEDVVDELMTILNGGGMPSGAR